MKNLIGADEGRFPQCVLDDEDPASGKPHTIVLAGDTLWA